jgi:misacylated tRNA(Ala) deacylase
MTKMLYMETLEAGYQTEFDATVTMSKPDWLMLDQSLFYPLGGGQDWDTGSLTTEDGVQLDVTEVTKRGPVKHVVGEAAQLVEEGTKIHGAIDWDRRFAHMRMHTAQHLVSGIAYEMFDGVRTVGNQLHADRSRIDLNPIDFTPEMISDLASAANDVVHQALPITDTVMTRDAINGVMPPDRTNMDLLPKSVTELRVIRIGEDLDLCPCAGTHVRNTKEIGEIIPLGRKSKGNGTQRLEYTLDGLQSE